MSQYMNFFIKVYDEFYKIDKFSRNHTTYQELDKYCHIPYVKITAVTIDMLQDAIVGIEEDKEDNLKTLENIKNEINLIASMNNSINEKLDAIYHSRQSLKEYEDSLENYDYAISFCRFLGHIIENFCDDIEDPVKGLYVGIEISNPTINDIV